jgi:opacity protein-like surface antigen
MKRHVLLFSTLAIIGLALPAAAQEAAPAGAGRFEVGVIPGGGTFFTKGSSDAQSSFKNYALGASATYNMNRFVGIEGELGGGLGTKQTIDFNQVSFADLKSPNTLAYNGNVSYYPGGNDRALVPYVTGGLGGLTMMASSDFAPLGQSHDETFFTQNVGAGVKWFSSQHWGLRGDYRYIIVDKKDNADPFFGLNENRFGHRISGSLLFTFGQR